MDGIFRRRKKPGKEKPPETLPALPPEPARPPVGFIEHIRRLLTESLVPPPPPPPLSLMERVEQALLPGPPPRALAPLRPPEPAGPEPEAGPAIISPEVLEILSPMEEAIVVPPPEHAVTEPPSAPPVTEVVPQVEVSPPAAAAVAPPFDWAAAYQDWLHRFPDIAEMTGGRAPRWLGLWEPPSRVALAQRLSIKWNLEELFDFVRSHTQGPWWERQVREAAHTGEVSTLEIEPVTPAGWGAYENLARFLGVPENIIQLYAGPEPENLRHFFEEVLSNLLDKFTDAMDLLRPRDLRGWFELELYKHAWPASYWMLVYKEPPRYAFA